LNFSSLPRIVNTFYRHAKKEITDSKGATCAARFRSQAFGWRYQPAIKRVKEAVGFKK
jgi:hypothetical protein